MSNTTSPSPPQSLARRVSAADLFTPKIITVLREGYGFGDLRADLFAGLTVAIVALPLSMAIAIASGVTPERGLFTAAIGGFLISALGGSRYQIGGPAAAFTVLVAATVARHGLDGLFLATIIAGLLLLAMGVFRLGSYIKFIPYPVTVGFISGIAVILFIGQIRDLLGLTLPEDPAEIMAKVQVLAASLPTSNPAAVAVSVGSVLAIVGLRRFAPQVPGILVAVVLGALLTWLLKLPVETIGTRFGGIPSTLPAPSLPPLSLAKIQAVFPDAVAFALLGAIESLLSAMVADGMTGRRHRSNMELVGQGIANIASALFGGITATGTVARTATNVRSGAHSPLAGMFHSAFIVIFMFVAAPLASYIPLASLAGVLAVVAWNMAEKHAFATLLRTSVGDAIVLIFTFGLTVLVGLTEAIVVGFALGTLLFLHRSAQSADVEMHVPPVPVDRADEPGRPYDAVTATDPDVAVYRITGAFFFGAAATVGAVLDSIKDRHKAFIIDFSAVPFIDSTAANTIAGVAQGAAGHNVLTFASGATPATQRMLKRHGATAPLLHFEPTLEAAIAAAHRAVGSRQDA